MVVVVVAGVILMKAAGEPVDHAALAVEKETDEVLVRLSFLSLMSI